MGSVEKLRTDLLFSASRVKGLYDNCLGHEIVMWLDEKCKDRQDAGLECDDSLRRFEDGAQMPFRKKWDTLRIPSYLRLDLEPRFLVGSIHYELPEKADREAMLSLLRQIDTLMQSVPAGEPVGAVNARDVFSEIESVEWSKSDVKKLADALGKKFYLLETLNGMSQNLKNKEWSISRMEAKKEELGRKFEHANESGDIQVSNEVLYERMALHEDILRMCHEKLVTLEQGIAKCTEERGCKLNEWKKGAASLDLLKDAKVAKQEQCVQDLSRLQHGIEYEAQQAVEAQARHQRSMDENDTTLANLNKDGEETSRRMYDLAQQFMAEEARLRDIANKRNNALLARMELITGEAQRVADFEEFLSFCKLHQSCLEETDTLSKNAVEALRAVQRQCTGSDSFMEQDFAHTKTLLHDSCLSAYHQLRQFHVDMYRDASNLKRRLECKRSDVEDELVKQELLAEKCREILTPRAKEHVLAARKLSKERDEVAAELAQLVHRMEAMDSKYFARLREKFEGLDIKVEHPSEVTGVLDLVTKEHLLDNRDVMLEALSDRVVEERENLVQFALQAGEQAAVRQAAKQALSASFVSADQHGEGSFAPHRSSPDERAASDGSGSESFGVRKASPYAPASPQTPSGISHSPSVTMSVGFPAGGITPLKQTVRREVRKPASYTPANMPVPRAAEPHKGGLPPPGKKYEVPPGHAAPAPFDAPTVASGRASPLEIAKQRRTEPRAIARPGS